MNIKELGKKVQGLTKELNEITEKEIKDCDDLQELAFVKGDLDELRDVAMLLQVKISERLY